MDFAQLSASAQAQRLEALAREALHSWSLHDARLALLKYRENAVFAVTSATGERYVMRVHRPDYRSDRQIQSEAEWMAALSEAGVRTPGFVATPGGDLSVLASAPGVPQARQCDVLHWVEGSPLGTLERGVAGDDASVMRSYRVIGELAARIHEHGVRWSPPPGFSRPSWDGETLVGESPTFGRFWELDCLSSEQLEILTRARDETRLRLDAFGRGRDRFGLIHGDLLPENILMSETGPNLIDFDDCGESWYGFELATGLFPILSQPNFARARQAYVDGYREIRALPEDHLDLMPSLLMARSLSYLGWPAGRSEMEEARNLAPFLAEGVTSLARKYLAGEPLAGS